MKITVKDGDVSFDAAGIAQAVHYAMCSTGKVKVIVRNGKTKEVVRYVDGERVSCKISEVRP